ncbi:MAG: OmpA family protein [Rubrivivax sp.]|jgi:OOP family OmpA-OmpF porin
MNAPTKTLIAIALATGVLAAQAQVKSFDKPPTLEELRKSLAAPQPAAAAAAPADTGAPRARGIVWNAAPAKADSAAGGSPSAQTVAAAAAEPAPSVALPINFAPGSSQLVGQSLSFIEPIAMLMRAEPSLRMVVEGHTDAIGSPERNLMLSWDRAMTVFKVLVERYGIEPQRLQPMGKGSTELVDPSNPGAAANRRVQFRPVG